MKETFILLALCAPVLRANADWVLEFRSGSDRAETGFTYQVGTGSDRYRTPMSMESNVTVCVWLKNPSSDPQVGGSGANYRNILGAGYLTNTGGFGAGLSRSGDVWSAVFQTRHYDGSLNQTPARVDVSDVMSDGKWHFWAFVYDFGYGYRIYRDGALAAESPWTASAGVTTRGFYPRRTFGIGKESWNGFTGCIAEVSLWREPLDAATVAELSKHRPAPDAPSLVGHWALDDGEGATTAADDVDLDALFAGWGATTGKKLHPMTLSGPVWVQDESFRLPSYEEWLHSKATIILVR